MKTATILKLVNKIVEFLFYFLNEAKEKERENNREQIKEDPSSWIDERYGSGVQSDGDSDKSESSSDDSKTGD